MNQNQVLLLPSEWARSEYQRYSVYLCHDNRPFTQAYSYLAFYEKANPKIPRPGKIHRVVPSVLNTVEQVVLARHEVEIWRILSERKQLVALVDALEKDENNRVYKPGRLGHRHKVIFLSSENSPETLRLPQDISHDMSGPFARGHRYFPVSAFKQHPRTTSELRDLIEGE